MMVPKELKVPKVRSTALPDRFAKLTSWCPLTAEDTKAIMEYITDIAAPSNDTHLQRWNKSAGQWPILMTKDKVRTSKEI